MQLSTKDIKGKTLGRVHYDGCTMTYREIGSVKIITCRNGRTAWEVASSITDPDIAKIWRDIKAEAKAA